MPVKVLVVDDSLLVRKLITRLLEEDLGITVVGTASGGPEALEKIRLLKPQVVTLDVEMPGMNGLETLSRIMREAPLPVIMLSSHTTFGARSTIEALALGAVDFVPKTKANAELAAMIGLLRTKIKVSSMVGMKRTGIRTVPPAPAMGPVPGGSDRGGRPREMLVIGCSTGGPAALHVLIPQLPVNLPVPVVVVQHMPEGFTGPLAEHLDKKSRLAVHHARNGDIPAPGNVYIAPAAHDLVFTKLGSKVTMLLNRGLAPLPPGGFRPSVDAVMTSAARNFGSGALGVVLTGMGSDGTRGALAIKAAGGAVLAQDKDTCVVYGMPRSVAEAGAADRIAPLGAMAKEILNML